MLIKSFQVQNFCCIQNETLPCDQLTALVGPNGSGKSSFLRALNLFYTSNAKYSEDDFYDRDTSQEIVVTVTFSNLTTEEKKLFRKYVENETLTVEKTMKWPSGKYNQKYYGSSLQNPDFDTFRSATGTDLRKEYNKLRNGMYPDLSGYTNKEAANIELRGWEESHPDRCLRKRDEGQFFGFNEVGTSHLEKFTRFIFIPAVRDASEDAAEGKGSPLTEIMDLVVRSVLLQRKEIIDFQEKTQKQYTHLVDPSKLTELQTLERNLSDTLKTYVPDAGVTIEWLSGDEIYIPMPKADIKLIEDNYPSSVERTGHGLQRAFILTMLQHLAVAQSQSHEVKNEQQNEAGEKPNGEHTLRIPNLIIAIEEPELYQHPNRQRHLSKILLKLATGTIEGVADCTQVIYCTHSPLFVDIKRFNKVRALRKVRVDTDKPKQTKVKYTTHDEVARIIEKADGKPAGTYTGGTLEPRLQTLMTPWMNEGFFADVAVLVEGPEDRAAILGLATELGHDFESIGISVIPCMGKRSIDRPTAIFKGLHIPVYVIWDSDFGKNSARKEDNHRLLRLLDQPIDDWPETVDEQFACFKESLTKTFHTEIGNVLSDNVVERCCEDLCLDKNHAIKNPQVIQEIIKEAKKNGKSSPTLAKIISQILSLRKNNAT